MKTHEAKAAKEAAQKLPVGFISQDVKESHEATPPPPEPKKESPPKEEIPFGFIAEDVKKQNGK